MPSERRLWKLNKYKESTNLKWNIWGGGELKNEGVGSKTCFMVGCMTFVQPINTLQEQEIKFIVLFY